MQDIKSKAETPVNRRTFRAVSEVVMYIPTKSASEIINGVNHAIMITLSGRLLVIDAMYLKG